MGLAISKCEKIFPKRGKFGVHIEITDNDRPDLGTGSQLVISHTAIRSVPEGEEPSQKDITEIENELQEVIDEYKKQRECYDVPNGDNIVSTISGKLDLI